LESHFKQIYFRHYARVVRVAYYILKDKDVSEDIAQDVFLKLWSKKKTLTEIKSIEGYLVQMAKNEAFDYLEKAKKESENLISLREEMKLTSGVNDSSIDEFRKSLEKGLSKLSPQCRLVFSLSRFEGLSNSEIADHLTISKRTVETQISNALRVFREDLRSTKEGTLVSISKVLAVFLL
jgi:RNA polymerase sigma-70 factor, ECF subfamily